MHICMCFIIVAVVITEGSFGGCFARLVEVTVNMKAGFNAVFDGLKKVENRFFRNSKLL